MVNLTSGRITYGITKISELVIDANKDFLTYQLNNVGTPTASTDAARKYETDAAITAVGSITLKGSFTVGSTVITTASTSFVNMPGWVSTITTGSSYVMINACLSVENNTTPSNTHCAIAVDGVVRFIQQIETDTANYAVPVAMQIIRALTAGAHTVKLMWKVAAGTSTVGNDTEISMSIIELRGMTDL